MRSNSSFNDLSWGQILLVNVKSAVTQIYGNDNNAVF